MHRDDYEGTLPTKTNYLFVGLLFFTSEEGDETTSPSFSTLAVAIEAASASLKVLFETLLPQGGIAKEATFPTAIKLLIANSLFSCADGEWPTPRSCALIGAYNTLL